MRRFWLTVAAVLLAAPVFAQTATPGQQIAFDFSIQNFTDAQIVRFDRRIDGGNWEDIGLPTVADDANTQAGSHSYVTEIPALVPGEYTVSFRACNVSSCGPTSPTLTFTLVVIEAPSNVRIRSGG